MIETCTYVGKHNCRRYDLIALHTDIGLGLVESCVQLLNNQWPRSHSARLHSLNQSNDCLPVCFALVEVDTYTHASATVGHTRLVKVVGCPCSVAIEAVVVQSYRRGEGIGRILMELTEMSCKKMGYKTVYLSTTHKEAFYSHLGYAVCSQVNTIGKQKLYNSEANDDNNDDNESSCHHSEELRIAEVTKEDIGKTSTLSLPPSLPVPPPAPPPPPTILHKQMDFPTWMKKDI